MKCKHCGEEKPETDFYNDKSKPNGKKPRCKPCDMLSIDKARRAKYEKEYWDKRRDDRRKMVLASYNKNKEKHKKQRRAYLNTEEGRDMHRRSSQTRRAREKCAFVEPVSHLTLYKKQGGICYLCGGKYELSTGVRI